MLLILPSAYADEDAVPLPVELPEHFVNNDDDTTLRLDTLELVTGIQANATSHENRLLYLEIENTTDHEIRITQNETDILFLLNWYNDITYTINKLLEYDFDIMRDDLDKNIDMVATNIIDIGTYSRLIDTNVGNIDTNTIDINITTSMVDTNTADILILQDWSDGITNGTIDLISYDLDIMNDDIIAHAAMINVNMDEIVTLQSITSYLNPTDICADGRDNDLDGLVDEYDGLFEPFTNFGNCSLVGLEDELEGTDIHGSTFEGTDLGGVTFSNVTINDTNFRSAVNVSPIFTDGSDVRNCIFTDSPNFVSFYNSDGSGCDFRGSNISGTVNFRDMSTGDNINLSGVTLGALDINNSMADSIDISDSIIKSSTFITDSITQNIIGNNITIDMNSLNIQNSDIDNSDLSNLYVRSFSMRDMNTDTINLTNMTTTYDFGISSSIINNMILSNGNFAEEGSISDSSISNSDFSGSVFNELRINDSNFVNTVFIDTQFPNFESYGNANFSNQNMIRVNFTNADIDSADFTGADLTDSIFIDSSIQNTSFINAILDGADFTNTNLSDVDLTGASLVETIFTGCTGDPICPPTEDLIITTDKTSYLDGETIVITGEVLGDLYSETLVSVTVKAPNENLVFIAQVEVGADKKFSTEMTAGGSLMKSEGAYIVTAQYGTLNESAETIFEFEGTEATT